MLTIGLPGSLQRIRDRENIPPPGATWAENYFVTEPEQMASGNVHRRGLEGQLVRGCESPVQLPGDDRVFLVTVGGGRRRVRVTKESPAGPLSW